jgi:hypothetical protein
MLEPATSQTDIERTIRELLSSERITSLDGLIERLVRASARRLDNEDTLLVLAETLWREQREATRPKPHRPPEMNLYVDRQRHDPARIGEFDGRALYFAPDFDAKGDPVMYGFTTAAGLQAHLAAPRHDIGTSNPDSLTPLARYAEHDDQQGDWLWNNPGRAWRDLTRVSRGYLGLGNWNDIVSSVDWCRWDISLYEHVNYGGSQLYLRAGRTYNHLSAFGWNDRASATVNWGTRF